MMPLPEDFDFDQGANLLGNYETAYHCLIARGKLTADDTVLIHGATGSTGLAAVHVAKIVGATVIATSRSAEKLAVVQEQGADHVVVTSGEDGPRFRDPVKELTGGKGVTVVYDGVGGDVSLESLRCVAFGARYLIVGWASTPFVAKERPNVLPTNLIMMKGLDVLGCPTVISTHRDPSIRRERLAHLRAWIDQGRLTPYVSRVFELSDFKEAMLTKWRSDFVGGCVVRP
jgi:NADPH2:quinone reductase